jgi:hypothetical protein
MRDKLPCYFCNVIFWTDELFMFDYDENAKKQYPICRKCFERIKGAKKYDS